MSVDLHPHTQCLSNPPCFFLSSFYSLSSRPSVCLSIHTPLSFSLSLRLSPSQTDSSDSDLELSTVRHQPEGLDQLQAQTKFTRKELQSLYRGFKNVRLSADFSRSLICQPNMFIFSSSLAQECPSGMVDEETFKTIYSQFFPQGGQRFPLRIFYVNAMRCHL